MVISHTHMPQFSCYKSRKIILKNANHFADVNIFLGTTLEKNTQILKKLIAFFVNKVHEAQPFMNKQSNVLLRNYLYTIYHFTGHWLISTHTYFTGFTLFFRVTSEFITDQCELFLPICLRSLANFFFT